MANPSPYRGLYINLERSTKRREKLERQLRTFGLEDIYAHFPAVDGRAVTMPTSTITPGETGAFLSHARALESARGQADAVHIVEDDVVLSEHVRPVIEDAVAMKLFDHFDLLFTDIFVNCDPGLIKFFAGAFDNVEAPPKRPMRLSELSVVNLERVPFACLTSYVVGAKSIDKILALYRAEIAEGPRIPVDLFIRDAVLSGKLKAALVLPFITTLQLEKMFGDTTDRPDRAKQAVMVLAVLRYSFFIGRDLEGYAKSFLDVATGTNRQPTDAHHCIVGQIFEFVMSKDFQDF